MKETTKIKILEQTGVLRILLILNSNETSMRPSQIQKKLEISNDAYYHARNTLIDMELIEKTDDKYTSTSYFALTPKGKKIAECIDEIFSIL